MNVKITVLTEKFIVYYTTDEYVNIVRSLPNKKTLDEFLEYNPPCKECLVQSMCLKDRIYIDSNNKSYRGINLKLCEKLKGFIDKNRPLFFPLKLEKSTY